MIVGCSGSETQLSLARRTLINFEFGRCCFARLAADHLYLVQSVLRCDEMTNRAVRPDREMQFAERPSSPLTRRPLSLSVSSHLPPPSLKDRRPSLSRRIVFYLEPIWGGRFYSPARCASPTPSLVALWPRTGVPPRAPSAPENGWSEQYSKRRRKKCNLLRQEFRSDGLTFEEILVSY